MKKQRFTFTAKVWLYPGEFANWHFVTLPKPTGKQIKDGIGKSARGFGSVPVEVTVGKTVWNTSIFPDNRIGSYILPLKAKVRQKEEIFVDEEVTVQLLIR